MRWHPDQADAEETERLTSAMFTSHERKGARPAHPLRALACALVAMASAGHCQYTWTLFVPHLRDALATDSVHIQTGFSLFVILQTTSFLALGLASPSAHHRQVMILVSLLLGAGLCGLSSARSLAALYCSCAAMGVSVGVIYNVCVTRAVQIVPERRGLFAGIVASVYGAGTLLTVGAIEASITSAGYSATLRSMALTLTSACLAASLIMPPRGAQRGPGGADEAERDFNLWQAAQMPAFWCLYAMLVLISTVGLVVTAQLEPIAEAEDVPASSLLLALQVDRALNGVSRPAWGLLSDYLGRERTLCLAFGLSGAVLLVWSGALCSADAFVACSALSTFSWGEVYSLFPALTADVFGPGHVSAVYGALYTGKAAASVIAGPVASFLAARFGWRLLIRAMAAASLLDGALAMGVLPRLVARPHDPGRRTSAGPAPEHELLARSWPTQQKDDTSTPSGAVR